MAALLGRGSWPTLAKPPLARIGVFKGLAEFGQTESGHSNVAPLCPHPPSPATHLPQTRLVDNCQNQWLWLLLCNVLCVVCRDFRGCVQDLGGPGPSSPGPLPSPRGQPSAGQPSAGPPKISLCFSLSHHMFLSFFPLFGVLLVEFWWLFFPDANSAARFWAQWEPPFSPDAPSRDLPSLDPLHQTAQNSVFCFPTPPPRLRGRRGFARQPENSLNHFLILSVFQAEKSDEGWVAPEGGAPKGGEQPGGWDRRAGGPKFGAFFTLPPHFSFFFLSLGGPFVELWWCLKRRGLDMGAFGVLGLSWKPQSRLGQQSRT